MSASPLGRMLKDAAALERCSMSALTVLSTSKDPFRLDTPTGHRDGKWLADAIGELGLEDRTIHPRGFHYAVLNRPKPRGELYTNTDKDWEWLVRHPLKAARWLKYVPFDAITDHRNEEAITRLFNRRLIERYISGRLIIEGLPTADISDIEPRAWASGFTGVQPYKLVLFGEKSSLADVLEPIANYYSGDLYLMTGEISDTRLYQMAETGAQDPRPMIVFTFCDCDPAGWQMPISISRKLQALKAQYHPDLEFEVRRVTLTPDQVRRYALPSTPLKPKEQRADKWRHMMGTDQTEIDALASLRPDILREITHEALEPFFDHTLARRVAHARLDWQAEAQAILDNRIDADWLGEIRNAAAAALDTFRAEVATINTNLDTGLRGLEYELPRPIVPLPDLEGYSPTAPLISSQWSFAEQCRRLIASKAYEPGDDEDEAA